MPINQINFDDFKYIIKIFIKNLINIFIITKFRIFDLNYLA